MTKTIKISESIHKELKRYVANSDKELMEDVAGFAIMDYLRSRNHKFLPIKKLNNGKQS